MPIFGSIIKKIIDISQNFTSGNNPLEEQKEVLQSLLEKAKDTAFGKYYGFSEILKEENIEKAFQKHVPIFDYHQMYEAWWKQVEAGFADITWPGRPSYFALSSGTTGKSSKRIPVTNDMLDSIRNAGLKQISAMANFDLPPGFFEKEIMMLGSSTNLIQREDKLEEGEISGISASNIPGWFRNYYKPGKEISEIDDWDERVDEIAKNANNWDIGAVSGIPSWLQLMFKKIIDYHEVDTIHDVWPNFQVYASGGVAFEAYEKSFNALLGKPVIIIDTYLASEGFLACQQRPGTTSMQLITSNGIYFEFVPFKPEYILEDGSLKQDAPVKTLAEVEAGEDYVLLISTVSGKWRYVIGDTITFTDVERAEIKITGRTKFFMNVVGSQLSVNKMNDGIRHLEEKYTLSLPEFVLSAVKKDGEFYHHWYIGTETKTDVPDEKLAEDLDAFLKESNKNYKVARSKALKGVMVKTIPVELFYKWSADKKKKGGQVKMEKIMKEEKLRRFQEFVENNRS